MQTFNDRGRAIAYFVFRWIAPVADPRNILLAVPRFAWFFRDWIRYARTEGAEPIRWRNTFPQLGDKVATSSFDRHYFFQDRWAFRKVHESGVTSHVDVGSRLDLIGFLSTFCRVTFVDIRPLTSPVDNVESKEGSILAMPYADRSVASLSCLHVAEHIGLGRYGDPIDPAGTRKACAELARVLAVDGNLYFSLPVGKPRLCFNAHRIHSPAQIISYFKDLTLVEFSAIGDDRNFVRNADPAALADANYACGLFHFVKRGS